VSAPPPPAGWYADPQAPSRWRWWDGARWTDNVSAPAAATGALTTADYLVVRASARLARWSATIHDRSMAQIGTVTQSGLQMRILDAAGAVVLEADGGSTLSWGRPSALRSWFVRDASGAQLGDLSVVKYVNRRITLALHDPAGQDIGRLEAIGKVDRDFSIADVSGRAVARVWRAERDRELLSEDETWAAQLTRPIPQPLDSLALAAVCTLDSIQHTVQNTRTRHRSSF
jgi:hypothetical protein